MIDEEIKASVTEKAIQYGVPRQHSSLFDNLENEFKSEFNKAISNRQFGLPIVRFSHPNGFWVIIGTKELAWFNNSEIQFIDLKEIDKCESLDNEDAKAKESNPMLVKFQLERLGLITKDNKRIELYLEKKEEYYTFWHMMIRVKKLID